MQDLEHDRVSKVNEKFYCIEYWNFKLKKTFSQFISTILDLV